MSRRYAIIVGDVVKSGKIIDRTQYWEMLQKVTNKVNKNYREEFYAPMTILKGDEVSAVLNDLSSVYNIMRDFQELFYPYQIRFASVYGNVDVALDTKNASLIDGPAFWKANDCLEDIKKEKRYFKFEFGSESTDAMLTTIANLVTHIKNSWSKSEKEIIDLYEKTKKQEDVAKKYNVSQQAVSNALKRSNWQIVRESEEIIIKVLKTYPRCEI